MTVMTIHKSKGLEFPVVIFPYADEDIYYDKNHYVWYKVDKASYCNFDHLMLNYGSSFLEYNDQSELLYMAA